MSEEIVILKRFISMLSDYGFKITFGNETNTLFLRKSIQALIKSEVPIVEVTLSRNEIAGKTVESGGGLFDVACTDATGNQYIVEMQLSDFNDFMKRSTFYASHRYATMITKGEMRFKKLKKIYAISIVDGVLFPDSKEYHHIGKTRNQHGELMSEEITQVIFELPKWNKKVEEIKDDIDKLIHVMKMTHTLTIEDVFTPPEFWTEEWIDKAIEALKYASMTPDERDVAQRMIVKAVHHVEIAKDRKRAIKRAEEEKKRAEEEKERAEAEKERAEAAEKKIEAEKKKTEAEKKRADKAEKKSKLQITNSVIRMLKMNVTPNDITKMIDGISLEEVLVIKEKLDQAN